MSGTILGNLGLTRFDVLVIGTGGGGGPVIESLTRLGKKVLALEAGMNMFDNIDRPDLPIIPRGSNDEIKLIRGFVDRTDYTDERTFRANEAAGVRTYVGQVNNLAKTLGGAAAHADRKSPRYDPQSFHFGTLMGDMPGAAFADWPVDYDVLEPFYVYDEKISGIQGLRGADPFAGPMSKEYPMPPGSRMYVDSKIEAGAKSLGYTIFPYPTAANSIPYDGRPACNDCGFCTRYICPTNARGSSAVTVLRRGFLTGNLQVHTQTRVVRILTNAAKNEVTGVEAIGPDGKRVTFTADAYVLAASPIEDARLLLVSDPSGPGIGNSSGMVGRCLMFHYETFAIGVFNERIHTYRGKTISSGFSDFRGKANDPNHPLGGIVEISSGAFGPVSEAEYYVQVLRQLDQMNFNGKLFKKLMVQSPARDRLVLFVLQAEDAPQLTNRVDLDPDVKDLDGVPVPRITYQQHKFELTASAFYQPKMINLLGAAGAAFAFIPPVPDISTSAHIMGTLRMGNDPKTSVCDKNGRFHDVGNLYNTDGAVFPTSSGFNPTHTIESNAYRIVGEMLFPGSPERVIPDSP